VLDKRRSRIIIIIIIIITIINHHHRMASIQSSPFLTIEKPHHEDINALIQLRDGSLVSCSDDCDVKRWSINTGRLIETYLGHHNWVNCGVELNDDLFATGGKDGVVHVWSSAVECQQPDENHHDNDNNHDDEDTIDHSSCLYRQPLASFNVGDTIFCIVKLFNQQPKSKERISPREEGESKKTRLMVGISGGKMMVLKVTLHGSKVIVDEKSSWMRETIGFDGDGWTLWNLCELSDGTIVIGDKRNGIGRWDLAQRKRVQRLKGHRGRVLRLVELRDKCLASSSKDNTIKIWDLSKIKSNGRSGVCIQTLIGHSHTIYGLVETVDGFLVTTSYDKEIRVWSRQDSNDSTLISRQPVEENRDTREEGNSDFCVSILNTKLPIFCLALLDDGSIATGCNGGARIEVRNTWLR